jgi:hypothetical protein
LASDVEKVLFGNYGTHALISFSLSIERIAITVAPWVDLNCTTEAVFERVTLLSFRGNSGESPEELNLPWDIIAFDSTRQSDGRWEFVLYCGATEFIFLADFPKSHTVSR